MTEVKNLNDFPFWIRQWAHLYIGDIWNKGGHLCIWDCGLPPAGYSAWSTSSHAVRSTGPSRVALWSNGVLVGHWQMQREGISMEKDGKTTTHKVDMLYQNIHPNKKLSLKSVTLQWLVVFLCIYSWSLFKHHFLHAQERCIHLRKKSRKGGRRPSWMRKELLEELRWKRKLHGMWKEGQITWEE